MPRRGAVPKTVGHRLVLTREALGLQPVEVRRRTGFSSSRLANYETNRYVPSARDAGPKLIKALGINASWLYEGNLELLPHHIAVKIQSLLEDGWAPPERHQRLGRPPMKRRQRST